MDSLPTWAVWSIVAPLVLLSPVIALLSALATDAVICEMVDAGAPAGAALAAVAGLLILCGLSAPTYLTKAQESEPRFSRPSRRPGHREKIVAGQP